MAAFDGESPSWARLRHSHRDGMGSASGSPCPLKHQGPSAQREDALSPAARSQTLHGGPSPAKVHIGVVLLPPALDLDFPTGIKCLAPKPEL